MKHNKKDNLSFENGRINRLITENLDKYIHSIIVVLGCLTLFYGAINTIGGVSLVGVVEIFTGLMLVAVFLFRRKLSQRSKAVFLALIFLMLLLFLVYDGATGNVGYLWIMIYPSMVFYTRGSKKGRRWTILGFISLIILSALHFLGILELPYDEIKIIQFNVVYGVMSFLTLLTEKDRQQRTNEVVNISSRLTSIIQNSQLATFVLDKKGEFVFSEGVKVEGFGLNQALGQSALEKYKDLPELVKGINKSLEGIKNNMIVKAGNDVYRLQLSPMMDKNNRVDGVMGLFINITTEQKNKIEMDKKLEEMEKMNKLMVGREIKMAEMKKELAQIKGETVDDES